MAEWFEAMEAEAVLCRVRVSTLERAYRRTRDRLDKVAALHPELADDLERVLEDVGALYDDAHRYSRGVPMSDAEFVKIATRTLPNWAKDSE